MNYNCVRKAFDAAAHVGVYFSVVFFAHVLVIAFQFVFSDEQIQGFAKCFLVLNVKGYPHKVLFSLALVRILSFR